jgi:transcriptional regulator with XRE-family HTH domain
MTRKGVHMVVAGDELRRLRQLNLMTQGDLADAAKVGRETVSRLESGGSGARPDTIKALGRVLGVDPRSLLEEAQ